MRIGGLRKGVWEAALAVWHPERGSPWGEGGSRAGPGAAGPPGRQCVRGDVLGELGRPDALSGVSPEDGSALGHRLRDGSAVSVGARSFPASLAPLARPAGAGA